MIIAVFMALQQLGAPRNRDLGVHADPGRAALAIGLAFGLGNTKPRARSTGAGTTKIAIHRDESWWTK